METFHPRSADIFGCVAHVDMAESVRMPALDAWAATLLPYETAIHLPRWQVTRRRESIEVRRDSCRLGVFGDESTAARALISDIELTAAAHSPHFVAVHAAVVAVHDQVIVLPGRSHAGKTTLAAALLRRGAVYFSDEYALLDDQGQVHPYPRPLSLRSGYSTATGCPADHFGARTAGGARSVSMVVEMRYVPASGWAVNPISRAEAALSLIENAVPASLDPKRTLDHCAAACRRASGYRGTRRDADEAADRLWLMCQ